MAGRMDGLRVAFLAAGEGTERVEVTEPWEAVRRENGTPMLVSPRPGEVTLFNHLDRDGTMPVDVPIDQARVDDFDALMLPGGVANPDQLRMDPRAVTFTRSFFDRGKPVAVICHGPWTLVEADVVRDRMITSWPSVRTDIRNAGGNWVDQEVAICENGPNILISSRGPNDLPAFCAAIVDHFSRQVAGAR